MEKTSSGSSSSRFNEAALRFAAVALVVPLLSGCATYTRIAPDGEARSMPSRTEAPPLRVVQCIVESYNESAAFQRGGTAERHRTVPGVQTVLETAAPGWFSSDRNAQPLVVKIRSEAGAPDDFLLNVGVFPGAATLATIPIFSSMPIRIGVSIQLGPGEWSEAETLPGREETILFNPVSQLIFSWFLSEEKGWQRERNDPMTAYGSRSEMFSPAAYMQGNSGFVRLLAERIVAAWERLPTLQRARARQNPVAWKLLEEIQPQNGYVVGPGGGEVPVPGPKRPVGPPILSDSGYDTSSHRGFVAFRRNGTEPVAALLWVRRVAIPALVGKGKSIRILGESTAGDESVRIEFEVLP